MRHARAVLRSLWLGALLCASACGHSKDGPTPKQGGGAGLDPQAVCVEQLDTEVTLRGGAMSPLPTKVLEDSPELALPTVELVPAKDLQGSDRSGDAVAIPDDPAAPDESQVRWTSQREMSFTVTPDLSLEPGLYTVRVTNRNGNEGLWPETLLAVPRPKAERIDPDILCSDGGTTVISGEGFIHVGDKLPTVTATPIASSGGEPVALTVQLDDCRALPGGSGIETCNKLRITLGKDQLSGGDAFVIYNIRVENPAPVGCVASEALELAVFPPPKITAVDPGLICDMADESTVVITGEGFLTIDGKQPEVRIDGETFESVASDCEPIEELETAVQRCSTLTVKVPKGLLPTGEHQVSVTNPAPADCSTSGTTFTIEVVEPPTVTAAIPTKLCEGGGTIAVTGTGFRDGIAVSVGGTPAGVVRVSSDTELSATFGALPLAPGSGPHDLTVSYSTECAATLSGAITIVPGPQLFFADPPVVYNGIDTQITLYGSGFSGEPTFLGIRATGSSDPPTSLSFTFNPAKPNQLQAVVPNGTAAGDYDVVLQDQTNCDAVLPGGLKVVDQVTLKLTDIVPPFGHAGATTGVTVFADPAVAGGFVAVPRLYLNPTTGTQAAAIEAVAFVDAGRVTAVVPAGLAVDTYDVIAVNPDGNVGLLPGAFQITTLPPPQPETITPGSIINTSNQAVTVYGSDFRNPTASMRCYDKGSGAETEQSLTVSASTATQVDLTVDASAYLNGAVCVVRITNDDGTYADVPGLIITNPAANLSAFNSGPTLNTPRRALAAVAAKATNAARFVYAIGGDDGTAANALATVEVATVDIFGVPSSTFFTQQNELPAPRTFSAAAKLGRCIYLAGGFSGSAEQADVLRACVLHPDERPQIVDLDLRASTTAGLGEGLWYYQVAAVMGASDPTNPGGETLPSEPFPVLLPALTGRQVEVIVHWSLVPGAVGYRVYRSPAADAAADALQLLASIDDATTTSYEDTGAAASGKGPLRLGATSVWHPVGTLAAARQGAGVTISPDPSDATTYYLYVMGGKAGNQALDTIEQATITVGVDGSQTVGTFAAGAQTLGQGRWQIGLFPVGNDNASLVTPPTRYVYAGGGAAANGTQTVNEMEVFEVQAGGALGAGQSVKSMQPPRVGYGYAPANNFLYVFGGANGQPDNNATSAKICGTPAGVGSCPGGVAPPELSNWNNAAAKMLEGRIYMGSALQSGFFYIIGGQTSTAAASTTSEYSNW